MDYFNATQSTEEKVWRAITNIGACFNLLTTLGAFAIFTKGQQSDFREPIFILWRIHLLNRALANLLTLDNLLLEYVSTNSTVEFLCTKVLGFVRQALATSPNGYMQILVGVYVVILIHWPIHYNQVKLKPEWRAKWWRAGFAAFVMGFIHSLPFLVSYNALTCLVLPAYMEMAEPLVTMFSPRTLLLVFNLIGYNVIIIGGCIPLYLYILVRSSMITCKQRSAVQPANKGSHTGKRFVKFQLRTASIGLVSFVVTFWSNYVRGTARSRGTNVGVVCVSILLDQGIDPWLYLARNVKFQQLFLKRFMPQRVFSQTTKNRTNARVSTMPHLSTVGPNVKY